MKNFKIISITVLITTVCLFTINYFTLIGLKAPHKPQTIWENEYRSDIFADVHPSFIVISDNITNFTIPSFGIRQNSLAGE